MTATAATAVTSKEIFGAFIRYWRFKGLGEISPDEFKHFIGKDIRLEPVLLDQRASIQELLNYYMGKNTQERQEFIIENLRVETDLEEEIAK